MPPNIFATSPMGYLFWDPSLTSVVYATSCHHRTAIETESLNLSHAATHLELLDLDGVVN